MGEPAKRPLAERLRAAAEWEDQPWWWDAAYKVGAVAGDDTIRSLLLEAAERVAGADCPTCENTGLHPAGDPDGLGCWDCARRPAGEGRR